MSLGWLAEREPLPPPPLAAALRGAARREKANAAGVPAAEVAPTALAEVLAAAAREHLDRAIARPGRARQTAFRLLEADALFTYACEAALEGGDATAALRRILVMASG